MTKQNNDSHKYILGLAVSTAIGAGILYYLRSARNRPTPILHKIGKTIVEVGEILEDYHVGDCSHFVEKAKNRAPSVEDIVSNVIGWVSTGLNAWKHLK